MDTPDRPMPPAGMGRLYRLAGVPGQCMAAWRSPGEVLAMLHPPLDGGAGDSDKRLQSLLQAPQIGAALAGALGRLNSADGVGNAAAADNDWPVPRRTPLWPGTSAEPVRALSAGMRVAPSPPLPPSLPSTPATAGRAAMAPRNPHGLPGHPDRAAGSLPGQGATGSTAPATPTAPRHPRLPLAAHSDVVAAVRRLPVGLGWPATRPHLASPQIDAAAATQQLDSQATRVGLAASWHGVVGTATAVRRGLAAGPAWTPDLANTGPVIAAAGIHARLSGALERIATTPALTALPATGRARIDTADGPVRVRAPEGRAAAGDRPAGAAPRSGAAPLQAARVGGFRGLAAMGLNRSASAPGPGIGGTVLPQAPAAAASRAHEPAMLDPQSLIDQVESALREQAARSGIALDGVLQWP